MPVFFNLQFTHSSNVYNISKKISVPVYVWLCCLMSFKCQKSRRNQFLKKGSLPKRLNWKSLPLPKVNETPPPAGKPDTCPVLRPLAAVFGSHLLRGGYWCVLVAVVYSRLVYGWSITYFDVKFICVYLVNCYMLKKITVLSG